MAVHQKRDPSPLRQPAMTEKGSSGLRETLPWATPEKDGDDGGGGDEVGHEEELEGRCSPGGRR